MLADGDACEFWQATLLRLNLDQAQIGGSAAHVADQHEPGLRQLFAQSGAVAQEPVVKNGLRFFQQAQFGQTGQLRRAQRQGAGAFVKRGRDGQHQFLLRQRAGGKLRVPGVAHMAQITGAGLDRRDFGHLGGCAPRQNRREPVHLRVREPAFGAGDESARRLRAQLARPLAYDGGRGRGCILIGSAGGGGGGGGGGGRSSRCIALAWIETGAGVRVGVCVRAATGTCIRFQICAWAGNPRQLHRAGRQLTRCRVIAARRQQR